MSFLLFLFLLQFVPALSQSTVTVQSNFGYLRGIRGETQNGFGVDYFRGVPFANKPQRFTKSKLVDEWPGIYEATAYPPKCVPVKRPKNASEYSEDCLYLNIITPSQRQDSQLLPVVIFIHGGGFQEGYGNDASCEEFAKNFVSQNMLVVTIQYRLGAFGFLNLGCDNEVVPCNIGLWDQVTAFEFVNRTIESFGGDHRNMTLMGHSAGAISASIHSISPISSRYFNNFIQLSGSSWGASRSIKKNRKQSQSIINDLNCSNSTRQEFLECANNKALDDFYSAQIGTSLWPSIGDSLLPSDPANMTANSKGKNLLIGLQTLESLYFTYLKSSPEIFPYITRSVVEDYINSSIAVEYGIESGNALNLASTYFLPNNSSQNYNYSYYMRQHTKIASNIVFDIAVLREIRDKMKYSKQSIFVYHFDYFNEAQFDANFPVKATYHCQEFPYLWNNYKDNYFDFNANDHKVAALLISAIGNFVKTGNPSSTSFTWPNTNEDLRHVRIQPDPLIDTGLFEKDYNFWDEMRKQFKYDLITGLNYETTGSSTAATLIPSILIIISYLLVA